MAADGKGNLFALSGTSLVEFAPGSTIGVPELHGVTIAAFAIDQNDDIYAAVLPPNSLSYAIEEFAPGASTPMRTIAGPNTQIANPTAIVVVPST